METIDQANQLATLHKDNDPAKDFLPLLGTDYIEFYVGNAKQAAYFYRSAFGFELIAYAGPETGVRGRASYAVKQDKIVLVFTTSFDPNSEISTHINLHGDGVKVLALWVDDARKSYEETTKRGAAGDYNIAYRDIDIHDPKGNKDSSGFLPDERAWMDKLFEAGMVDSFRHMNTDPHQYSWWSYRANARNNNKGWRIDYINVSESMKDKIRQAVIHPDVKHSDHCPVLLELDI